MERYVQELQLDSKTVDIKVTSSRENTLIVSAVSVFCDENLNFYNVRESNPLTPTFNEKPDWHPPNIDF